MYLYKLYHCHRSSITLARRHLNNAGVSARALRVPFCGLNELCGGACVAKYGNERTAGSKRRSFALGKELLDHRADFLGTGLGGLYFAAYNKRAAKAVKKRTALVRLASEFSVVIAVSHGSF